MWYVKFDGDYVTEQFESIEDIINFVEVTKYLSDEFLGGNISGVMWCQDEDAFVLEYKNGLSTIVSNGEFYYYRDDLSQWNSLNNVKLYF